MKMKLLSLTQSFREIAYVENLGPAQGTADGFLLVATLGQLPELKSSDVTGVLGQALSQVKRAGRSMQGEILIEVTDAQLAALISLNESKVAAKANADAKSEGDDTAPKYDAGKAKDYDLRYNEGAEGYNPYRR